MDTHDKKGESASVVSDDDSATVYTPTHTTEHGNPSGHDSFSPCAPSPGRTYLIRHRDSGKTLNKYGRLGLENDSDTVCYWGCIQTLGWFGFSAFGKYLGRDGRFAFRATAELHLPWEWFVITAQ
ncbi:hypothetical protein F4803DRAFT_549738 [Xylaria telfairii]|nr:hypothetical protein F4803DRAFT_549738 [Xylaria telfairii]